ncbi:helix-turn-helix domain-containing protein [Sulfurospirillum multivorans]|uniref:Transcriptional regulator, XRE family protein n=2 Tax=Sulfurospirillum multivorans TaxID=66821 RepID=A0AA86ALS2_SULMK|nr:helix-turn-helix domain-containing protein [Sulfurospirillum multivorans]AHJ12589.1 transcriptional regulator, XRE family protein [Sulfurospirillum multivorans DSM 12446]QEH06084.1 transcriptional regulator, XRE family protein [Sulfurospirillum multivorans]
MDLKEFGTHIAQLRKEKKISQAQLAHDLNISRATISSLENGINSNIGIKTVLNILDYLGYELTCKEKSPFPTFEELKEERARELQK